MSINPPLSNYETIAMAVRSIGDTTNYHNREEAQADLEDFMQRIASPKLAQGV